MFFTMKEVLRRVATFWWWLLLTTGQVAQAFVHQPAAIRTPRSTTPNSSSSSSSSSSSTTTTTTMPLWMHNQKKRGKKTTSRSSTGSSTGNGSGSGSTTGSRGFASTTGSSSNTADSFPYAGSIRPGRQTPQRVVVPSSPQMAVPDYATDGIPKKKGQSLLPWIIDVKTPEEIQKMKAAGRLARQILDLGGRLVQPGVTTDEIDEAVHRAIVDAGAYPSPLNYHGFPKSCCTSVNEVICHGIPDDRKLQDGDVINLDITVYLDGYHGDCSEMFVAGTPDDKARHLLQVTYDCWIQACQYVQPGRDYKDLGGIIEDYITPHSLSTVRNFCGHGIGSVFHTTPNILHYRNNEPNGQMAVGHTFTIEPMICERSSKVLSWPDDWTATTVDGGRSAQFEHTLLVTEDGVEALTAKTENSPLQFWEQESKVHQGFFLGTSKEARKREEALNAKILTQN